MDTEGPHEHGHTPHRTGFRWLDISLALSAFFVSFVSLGLAIHHGRTMDKLVTSNSYPNIDFENGSRSDLHDGQGPQPVLYIALVNTGIGPARVHAVLHWAALKEASQAMSRHASLWACPTAVVRDQKQRSGPDAR